MYHPDRARFFQDYIPFTKYRADELVLDYGEQDEAKLAEARRKFVTDTYPDRDFTPNGWLQKQLGIHRNSQEEFANAFQIDYNPSACRRIQRAKAKYCKGITQKKDANDTDDSEDEELDVEEDVKEDEKEEKKDNRMKCIETDEPDILKKNHDRLMKCRNLRAIESFSNCKNIKHNRWIQSNSINR